MNDNKLEAALGPRPEDGYYTTPGFARYPKRYFDEIERQDALTLEDLKIGMQIFAYHINNNGVHIEGEVAGIDMDAEDPYIGIEPIVELRQADYSIVSVHAFALGLSKLWGYSQMPVRTFISPKGM